jgi:hypothetical protein
MVTSAHLGVFPATFPSRDHIDWLPVDKLSPIFVEIMASSSGIPRISPDHRSRGSGTDMVRRSSTFHVINPQALLWSRDVVPGVLNKLLDGTVRPVVGPAVLRD